MGQVTVTLNGRTYRLSCGDGEEERLLSLAGHVRERIEALSTEFGHAGDDRLLLMAALLVTDELFDARDRLMEFQSVERRQADMGPATPEPPLPGPPSYAPPLYEPPLPGPPLHELVLPLEAPLPMAEAPMAPPPAQAAPPAPVRPPQQMPQRPATHAGAAPGRPPYHPASRGDPRQAQRAGGPGQRPARSPIET